MAFLFTGQGAQHVGMGRALEQHHPHFRASIDECDAILQPLLGRSIREILYPSAIGEAELINQTIYTQPALFALEYALAKLWWSWGVRPSHVLGHSLGEYVAACMAGILTLEDALQMVVQRSQLMQSISVPGGMAAVMATEEEVAQRLAPYSESVSIAAVNGPKHVVISGAAASLELISGSFHRDGISAHPAQGVARVPFPADGAGSRSIRKEHRRHSIPSTQAPAGLECKRIRDLTRRGRESPLLAQARPPGRAFHGRHAHAGRPGVPAFH